METICNKRLIDYTLDLRLHKFINDHTLTVDDIAGALIFKGMITIPRATPLIIRIKI